MLPYIYIPYMDPMGILLIEKLRIDHQNLARSLFPQVVEMILDSQMDMMLDIQYVVDPLLGKYTIISFRGKNFM
jgi:hypothetical protein